MFKIISNHIPLSAQEQLMFGLHAYYKKLGRSAHHLNLGIEWQLPLIGMPSLDVVKDALKNVVILHPNLRVVFQSNTEGRILKKAVPSRVWQDIDRVILHKRPEKASCAFVLDEWPLFRFWMDHSNRYVGLSVHHIIADGVGAVQILTDIGRCYFNRYIPFIPALQPDSDWMIGTLAKRQITMAVHSEFSLAVKQLMNQLVCRSNLLLTTALDCRATEPFCVHHNVVSLLQTQLLESQYRIKASHTRILQWMFSWSRLHTMPSDQPFPIRKQRRGDKDLPVGYHAGARVYQPPKVYFDFPLFCFKSEAAERSTSTIQVDGVPLLDVWTFEGLKMWTKKNLPDLPVPLMFDEFNYIGRLTSPPPPFPIALVWHCLRTVPSTIDMGVWQGPDYSPQCVATVSKIGSEYQFVLSSLNLELRELDMTMNCLKKLVFRQFPDTK